MSALTPPPSSAADAEDRRSGLAGSALHLGFFLVGLGTVLLGPILPELSVRWEIAPARLGALFLAQFIGSAVGSVAASFHLRRSIFLGYGLLAAGFGLLPLGGWSLAPVAMGLVGLGLGLSSTASNLWVGLANPRNRGAALARINLVWGIGAVSCFLAFAALRHLGRSSSPGGPAGDSVEIVLWPAAGLALLITAVLAMSLREPKPKITPIGEAFDRAPEETPAPPPVPGPSTGAGALRRRGALLAVLAGMFFLYIGTEIAVGGWLVVLADRIGGEQSSLSMVIGSCFWAMLLLGRAAAPAVLRRLSEPALYGMALALAGAGSVLLFQAATRPVAAVAAAMTGLGLAPLFPLTASFVSAATARSHSRVGGLLFACGAFGGAVLPWLTGRVGGAFESFRMGFLVPVAGLVVLAGLFTLHQRLFSPPDGDAPAAS